MSQEWLEQSLSDVAERNVPLPGVAAATVVENIDFTGQGRVQIELPWFSGMRPWARVASPGAGKNRGFYMIPQKGDEVLVAFTHGDIREPYVIGSLWSGADPPPYSTPEAPSAYRLLKTPLGHELEFDDLKQTIVLKTKAGQKVELSPTEILITPQAGMASISLGVDGTITVTSQVSITCKAPEITLSGVNVKIKAEAMCEIQGGVVKIN